MVLHEPFKISARLLPALQVGDCWISLGLSGRIDRDGRDIYDCWIDIGTQEYRIDDLCSGCQGGSVIEGFGALLAFLTAAVESREYRERTGSAGENEDLFESAIVDWASQHSDELSMLALEIEERGAELIVDE